MNKSDKELGVMIGMTIGGVVGTVAGALLYTLFGSTIIVALTVVLTFTLIFGTYGGFMGFLIELDTRNRNINKLMKSAEARQERENNAKTQPLPTISAS
ncbi:MAG: hypothetical protein D6768_13715 [Chloroflexi bacterium]|nr:MAG: hypothetical protein D6768_13715 [Chloroflexota bacterium]